MLVFLGSLEEEVIRDSSGLVLRSCSGSNSDGAVYAMLIGFRELRHMGGIKCNYRR